MVTLIRWAFCCGLVGLIACDRILDIPDDPVVAEAGSAFSEDGAQLLSGPWACLDGSRPPPPPAVSGLAEVPITVRTCSYFAPRCSRLIDGLTGRLCAKLDPGCKLPELDGLTQKQGVFSFDVPTLGGPFDGYLAVFSDAEPCYNTEVFGDEKLCALLPECDPEAPSDDACLLPRVPKTMLFFSPPVGAPVEQPFTVPVVPMVSVYSLLSASGDTSAGRFDLDHGLISASIVDCNGVPAPDVSFEVDREDESMTTFYFEQGVPTVRAKHTDISGVGGISGVKPGYVLLTARLPDGRKVAEASLLVEGLAASYVTLTPHYFPPESD